MFDKPEYSKSPYNTDSVYPYKNQDGIMAPQSEGVAEERKTLAASKSSKPRSGGKRWRSISFPARSVGSTDRAQSDDRSRPRAAQVPAGRAVGSLARLPVLQAREDCADGSRPDAHLVVMLLLKGTHIATRPFVLSGYVDEVSRFSMRTTDAQLRFARALKADDCERLTFKAVIIANQRRSISRGV